MLTALAQGWRCGKIVQRHPHPPPPPCLKNSQVIASCCRATSEPRIPGAANSALNIGTSCVGVRERLHVTAELEFSPSKAHRRPYQRTNDRLRVRETATAEERTVDAGNVHVGTGLDGNAHHEHNTPARDRVFARVHVGQGTSHERTNHGTEFCAVSRWFLSLLIPTLLSLTENSGEETLRSRSILLIELQRQPRAR